MEKECERIDGTVDIDDPPVIINTGHPKIKAKADASCNVLCIMNLIFILQQLQSTLYVNLCWYVSEMSCFYTISSADTTTEAFSSKPGKGQRQ